MAATNRQAKGGQPPRNGQGNPVAPAKTGKSATHPAGKQARAPKNERPANASSPPSADPEQETNRQPPQRDANASETNQGKVIKDTFSFPPDDYALIAQIQDAMLDERMVVNKGEVLRAGLHALLRMSGEGRKAIFKDLKKLKAGRRLVRG